MRCLAVFWLGELNEGRVIKLINEGPSLTLRKAHQARLRPCPCESLHQRTEGANPCAGVLRR